MSSSNVKTALVLSGGSIKGSFQAGAIRELLERGLEPDAIYGISVGALNGAFLADAAGQAALRKLKPDWKELGRQLWDFWAQSITSPGAIIRKRGIFSLIWAIFRKRFNGLVDTRPLRDLLYATVKQGNLAACPIPFKVGGVNMDSGELEVADQRQPQLIEYVLGSAAIPVLMPLVRVGQAPLTDGGVRDVALIGKAVDDGATRIVCILCQPEKLAAVAPDLGNLLRFASRLMEIIVNETVTNDIQTALRINALCPADGSPVPDGPLAGKRRLDLTIIRPAAELPIDLDDFTAEDIKRMMELGRKEVRNNEL